MAVNQTLRELQEIMEKHGAVSVTYGYEGGSENATYDAWGDYWIQIFEGWKAHKGLITFSPPSPPTDENDLITAD